MLWNPKLVRPAWVVILLYCFCFPVRGNTSSEIKAHTSPKHAISFLPSDAATSPQPNATNISRAANLVMRFSAAVDITSVTSSNFIVWGERTGLISGTLSGGGTNTITFDPVDSLQAGEIIWVTITENVLENGTSNKLTNPYSYRFTVATSSITNSQFLDPVFLNDHEETIRGIHTADLTGDGIADIIGSSDTDTTLAWYDGASDFSRTLIDSTSGRNYYSVVAADLDNDQDMDIVYAAYLDSELGWYENTSGDGTTWTRNTIGSSLNGIRDIYPADMNNDGFLDIVIVHPGATAAIAWFENDGNTNPDFGSKKTINNVGTFPHGVRIGDLNEDGYNDIVVAQQDSVYWIKNNGNETFDGTVDAADTIVTSRRYNDTSSKRVFYDVYLEDVDNDGHLDVIPAVGLQTTASNTRDVSYYTGDGLGSFSYNSIGSVSNTIYEVKAADINGDSYIDIAVSNTAGKYHLFMNNGAGSFSETELSVGINQNRVLELADADNDGDIDLIGASTTGDSLFWFEHIPQLEVSSISPAANDQGISLSSDIAITFNVNAGTATSSDFIVRGEFQGLIGGIYTTSTNTITFNPNNNFLEGELIYVTLTTDLTSAEGGNLIASYSFQFTATSTARDYNCYCENIITEGLATENFRSIYPVDLDEDGDMDVVATSLNDIAASSKLLWYRNDGQDGFVEIEIATVNTAFGLTVADFDGINGLDIVVGGTPLILYTNDGDQSFSATTISASGSYRSIQVVDLDGDADLDIIGAGGSEVHWWQNNGPDPFTKTVLGTLGGAYSVHFGDLDKDGDMDVVAAYLTGREVVWYENDNNSFTEITIDDSFTSDDPYSTYLADMDNDEDLDVVVALFNSNSVVWYENQNLTFQQRNTGVSITKARHVYAMDITGDGNTDIVSYGHSADLTLLVSDGNPAGGNDYPEFTKVQINTGDTGGAAVYVADMDNDGILDILSGAGVQLSLSDGKLAWYKGSYNVKLDTGALNPSPYNTGVARDSNIEMVFGAGEIIDNNAADSILIWGDRSGILDGSFSVNTSASADTVIFNPTNDFFSDEIIHVTITKGFSCNTYSYQFRAAAAPASHLTYKIMDTLATDRSILRNLRLADLNDDMRLDLLAATDGNNVSWFDGTNGFSETILDNGSQLSVGSKLYHKLFNIDVDGDGDQDVVYTSNSDSEIGYFKNQGAPNYISKTKTVIHSSTVTSNGVRIVVPADVDHDGDLDLFYFAPGNGVRLAWLENNGASNPSFTHHEISIAFTAHPTEGLTVADTDADGDLDIITSSKGEINLFTNDGSENFTINSSPIRSGTGDYRSVQVEDMDGDGDLDIVPALGLEAKVLYYKNNGNNSFAEEFIETSVGNIFDVITSDFDGDGDYDILMVNNTDIVYWYLNDGTGTSFTKIELDTNQGGIQTIDVGDLDNDNDLDIIVGSTGSDNIFWLKCITASLITSHTSLSASPDSRLADGFESASVSVQLVDEDGDNIEFSGVDVTFSSDHGNLSSATATTDGSGIATVTITATQSGDATITATVDHDGDENTTQGTVVEGSPQTVSFYVSPTGSITNLSLWLRADSTGTYVHNTGMSGGWQDHGPNQNHGTISDGSPVYLNDASNNLNFNPEVSFDGNDAFSLTDASLLPNGGSARTYFIVSTNTDNANNALTQFTHGNDNPGQAAGIIQNSGGYEAVFSAGVFNSTGSVRGISGSTGTQAEIAAIRLPNNLTNNTEIEVNGDEKTVSLLGGSDLTINTGTDAAYLGRHFLGIGTDAYDGKIHELIIFDSYLDDATKQKVDSYLALKYGITLSNDFDQDGTPFEFTGEEYGEGTYINSDFTPYWEVSNAQRQKYHNDVAGIGRDDMAGLQQKQSKSINSDAILTIGLDNNGGPNGLESTNGANDGTFGSDKSFLVWGNNNKAFNPESTDPAYTQIPPGVNSRLNRQWYVQENGTLGTVTVQFDVSGLPGLSGDGTNIEGDIKLLISDEDDFTSPTATVSVIDQAVVNDGDGLVNFRVDFTSGSYFTLASAEQSALAVALVDFDARIKENTVVLEWATSSEDDHSHFRVEKSATGRDFETLTLTNTQSNRGALKTYKHIDHLPYPGHNYYRLVDVDMNGKENISKIIRVNYRQNPEDFEFKAPYPNPVKRGEAIHVPVTSALINQKITLILRSSTGRELIHETFAESNKHSHLIINTSTLPSGLFLLELILDSGVKHYSKIVIRN
ncbi:MAG: hypothetical protein HEP71_20305 [Roseivirga sp.]|nr:hypothetical protein [Roseivirga sp.]